MTHRSCYLSARIFPLILLIVYVQSQQYKPTKRNHETAIFEQRNVLYVRKFGCDYGYCFSSSTNFAYACVNQLHVLGGAVSQCCTDERMNGYRYILNPTASSINIHSTSLAPSALDPYSRPSIDPFHTPTFAPPSKTPNLINFPAEELSWLPTTTTLLAPSMYPNNPTKSISYNPTKSLSYTPSHSPSAYPITEHTYHHAIKPTVTPTNDLVPTLSPTQPLSNIPSIAPTSHPSVVPSLAPSLPPSLSPSLAPSLSPTLAPSSLFPTLVPSIAPSESPTYNPTDSTINPTSDPTVEPTTDPTYHPTHYPTTDPTNYPTTAYPTIDPTHDPTYDPTIEPTFEPTAYPTNDPTHDPTTHPTTLPTNDPTLTPTDPTQNPTTDPTIEPTYLPTIEPTYIPTIEPTSDPTPPTTTPTSAPSYAPSLAPSLAPTIAPSISPTISPTKAPSDAPSIAPSFSPISVPTSRTTDPTYFPTNAPTATPTYQPTCETIEYTWDCFQGKGGTPGLCRNQGYDGTGTIDIGNGEWNWPYALMFEDCDITISGQGMSSTVLSYTGSSSSWIGCFSRNCILRFYNLAIGSSTSIDQNNYIYKQIDLNTGGQVYFFDVLFDGNNYNLNNNGESLWRIADQVTATFESCLVTNNDAIYEFLFGSTTYFRHSVFLDNTLTVNNQSQLEAMLYINNAKVIFRNCSFVNNTFANTILLSIVNASNVVFDECTFISNNIAFYTDHTAMIHVDNSVVEFIDCVFKDNIFKAAPLIESQNNANISIENTEFNDNIAQLETGLILLQYSIYYKNYIEIMESVFTKNMDFISLIVVSLPNNETINVCPANVHKAIRIVATTWIDNNCNYMTCNSLFDTQSVFSKPSRLTMSNLEKVLMAIIALLFTLLLIVIYGTKQKLSTIPSVENENDESNTLKDTVSISESDSLNSNRITYESKSSTKYSHISNSEWYLGD
eukprot:90495_1